MFYGTAPNTGRIPTLSESLLHAIKRIFVLPARDSAINAGGALRFD